MHDFKPLRAYTAVFLPRSAQNRVYCTTMRRKQLWLTETAQRLFITWITFLENDLLIYASAGAYGFLLSALPTALMVLAILVRVLHTAPERIRDLFGKYSGILPSEDFDRLVSSITSVRSVGVFEIILGLSIFWMARRFFTSFQQGMSAIYRKRGRQKPIKETLIVISGEIILVILVVSMAIFLIAGNAVFRTMFARSLLGPVIYGLVRNLFRFVPLGIIVAFLFLVYFFTPRERPTWKTSLLAASACAVSFAAVQAVFRSFVNMTRYNLVYGFLSNVIVILLEVFVFFLLFLFFAQFQYVMQFFESFLVSRIYRLPGRNERDPFRKLERRLFARPALLYRTYAVKFAEGETVYALGEDSTDFYYVWRGSVRITAPSPDGENERTRFLSAGEVFGDLSGLIGGRRTSTAVAASPVLILKLPGRLLREAIEVDGAISRKTLGMVTDYVRETHGATVPSEREM